MVENMLEEGDISLSVSDSGGCMKAINVEIANSRFGHEKERVLRDLLKDASIPGFRKGKVPPEIARRRFAGEIRSKALERILPLAYRHVLSMEKFEPVGEPAFHDIKADDNQPLTFRVEIEVAPEIELSEYRGLKVEMEEVSITDEEIEEVLSNIQGREAEYIEVDRPAVSGDIVVLDYGPVGSDGKVIENKKITNYPVELGAEQIFPAFEKAVAGKAKGVTATVEIEYPEDYEPEHLRGRKVRYEFTIQDIKEKRLPPLTDEFASKIDKSLRSMKELREDIRNRLVEEKSKEARRRREERAVDILIERHPFDVPGSMRERFKRKLYEEDGRRRKMMGVGPEEDEKKKQEIDELFTRIAARNIKRYFILDQIARKEGIAVSGVEVDGELEVIAGDSGRPLEEVRKHFADGGEPLEDLKGRMRVEKTFEVILGKDETG